MQNSIFIRIIAFFIVSAFFAGCSSTPDQPLFIRGEIVSVGDSIENNLAIKTEDNKYFVLECSKEIYSELVKNQGARYSIFYDRIKEGNKSFILVVKSILKL